MRALHLVKTSVGATWALRQVRELVALGVDVHVALPAGGTLVGCYAEAGATEHHVQPSMPLRQPFRVPAHVRALRTLVHDVRPDVIHSHFVGTTVAARLALGRNDAIPRLFQIPGPLHLEHPLFRRLERGSAGSADYWMGSCRWTCDRLRASGIAEDRVFLAYYGSDLDHVTPRRPGKLRSELGLAAESKIVGMVAYFYAPKRYLGQRRGLKGHEDLIDALAIVAAQDPNVVGVFVGGPWAGADAYAERVRAYAAEKLGKRVHFLGTRNDVPDLYADFDVAVHPSHSENVGGAAESQLLGVPTIATNVGGFPDLVKPGETGWLVPPADPPALAGAIRDALADPQRARCLAMRGQALAREVMDVRANARDVLGAYEAMLDRRREARR